MYRKYLIFSLTMAVIVTLHLFYFTGRKSNQRKNLLLEDNPGKNSKLKEKCFTRDLDIINKNSRNDTKQRKEYQTVSECDCDRPWFYPAPGAYNKELNSTCSDEASFYETGQKVVSISMHYKKPVEAQREKLYKEGILLNLKAIREYYPSYTLRLYTDTPLEKDYCKLICQNSDLFWCDIRKTPALGDESKMFFMAWRFLVLGDPTVDLFLSRDLDSVITEREAAVVGEWLQSDKAFHLMRDKERHHNVPILGGMWGGRNSVIGLKVAKTLQEQIIQSSTRGGGFGGKGGDQFTLNDVIFFPRKMDILAFDSYHCRRWRFFTEVRPFPTQRTDNQSGFVGNPDLGRQIYNLSECPAECRPKYGLDWKYC